MNTAVVNLLAGKGIAAGHRHGHQRRRREGLSRHTMSDTLGTDAATGAPVAGHARSRGAAPAASPAPPRAAARRRGRARMRLEIALLSGPAIVMFLAFVIFPVALAAYYGFYRWHGYGPPTDWVGLNNYKLILTDPAFQQVLWHNFMIVVLSLVIQGPLAIVLALLLNRKIRGRSLIRVLIFVPYVISEVIVGTGWSLMLQSNGALNDLLEHDRPRLAASRLARRPEARHLDADGDHLLEVHRLRGDPDARRPAVIPEELYEAAAIDGASYWQIQRRITLPLLGPTIRIWAFLSIIGSLQLFDLVYIIWGQYVVAAPPAPRPWRSTWSPRAATPATTATAAPSPS